MIWWHRIFHGEIKWSPYGYSYQQARCAKCNKRWVRN